MIKIPVAVVILSISLFLGACGNDPYSKVLPDDVKTMEAKKGQYDTIFDTLDSKEDQKYVAEYLFRMSMASELSGSQMPKGVTIRKAIESQKKWEQEQSIVRAQEKISEMVDKCVINQRHLGLAIFISSEDNSNVFPLADTWCDSITNAYRASDLICPAAGTAQPCHYAYNSKIQGLARSNVNSNTVMLFETVGGWNVNGGLELLLKSSRHGDKIVVTYVDGSVHKISQSDLKALRWEP